MNLRLSTPKEYDVGEPNQKAAKEIEYVLLNKIKDDCNMVVIVLPSRLKSHYRQIKKICYCQKRFLSQCVLQETLQKRGVGVICPKLLAQVAAKAGSQLWATKPPEGLPAGTMVVGIDVSESLDMKGKNVVGVCSSLTSHFTRYYSRT